jgi:glycosyltransferase involved in cell wall biosynthesis
MKILMVSSYLPYPLHSGGQIRLYNLIRELSVKHEVTLICEKRKYQTDDDIRSLEKICKKVVTVEKHKQWSLKNIGKTAVTPHSFLVTGHTHPKMQNLIKEELAKEKFDLIHVETFYVIQNLPATSLPIVLVDHNIEYRVYKKFVDQAPLVLRPLLTLDIAKIKKEEENSWKQVTKVVAVSEEDKKVMEQKNINPAIVPNGVNIDEFSFKLRQGSNEQKKILFIGDFKWIQNIDSAKFIIREIWPQIKANGKLKLWIVGREIPASIRSLTDDPDVLFDEESSGKSTPEIFQAADILLAPIRVGGGTSYKILEAMSCGTPVVTMPMSASAIHAKGSEHLMIGKTARELAEKTIELSEDEKLYKKIAKHGRELIEEKYSWEKIAKDLEEVYKNVILNP